jgi:carbamoyl-phosphate synthase large subunit
VFVIGANSVAEAAGNFSADVTHLVPQADREDEYAAAIERLIAEHAPDLVIPSRDDDILVLARMQRRRGPKAALLVGSSAAAEIMDDKQKSADFAARHGLPFAPTAAALAAARALAAAHGFPLIGKPRCGNGARGVVILRTQAELERAFAARADLVAQPFLDMPEEAARLLEGFEAGLPFFFSFPERAQYTTQMIIGPDGAASAVCACRNIQVGGQAVVNERIDDVGLIALAERYGAALRREGWAGPINIQAKRTADGVFVPFEMNGRFGGGTAARTLMGYDEVAMAIRAFVPAAADFPAFESEPSHLVQKALTSAPVRAGPVEELRRTGRWERR